MKRPDESPTKPIVFRTATGYEYFEYDDIILFRTEGHKVECLITNNIVPIRIYHSFGYIIKKYGYSYFTRCNRSTIVNLKYIKNLEIKTKQLHLKNNIVLKVSDEFARYLKNSIETDNSEKFGNDEKSDTALSITGRLKIFFSRNSIRSIKDIFRKRNKLKTTFISFILISFLLLISQCENTDKFIRPNLPEKLCIIGIIDVDDTTLHHVSFEKSFQSEYPGELNDSLRNFSFSIFSTEKELFNYHSDTTIKELNEFEIPANIDFRTGEKYYITAQENSTSPISAIATVPYPPSEPLIASIKYEKVIKEPLPCLTNINHRLATIGFSFENDPGQNLYYAILMEGAWLDSWWGSDPSHFEARKFEVTECNAAGFFAPVWGYTQFQYKCGENHIDTIKAPLTSYFIEGSKIPGNKCIINVSTVFIDYIILKERKKIRIKVLSIPKELFLFEKSLNTYARNSSDPFSEPVYLNGNIKNGNGSFAICRSTDMVINLPKPLPL